jgi:hypothetical protein
MSKLKPIIDIVTDATKTTVKTGRAAERLNPSQRAGSLGFIDEYEKTAGELEKANEAVPAPRAIQEEIARKEAEAFEETRQVSIRDPKVDVTFDLQARTPEEYAERLTQFRDPEYGAKSAAQAAGVNMPNPADKAVDIPGRWSRWDTDNQPVYNMIESDRALQMELREFTEDGAYKANWINPDAPANMPAVFWHTDVFTDPRLGQKGFIQFDLAARESGLHGGSKTASSDVKGGEGVRELHEKALSDMQTIFERVTEAEELTFADETFLQAFEQVRTNTFLRHKESAVPTPDLDMLNQIVDDFFEEIQGISEGLKGGNPLEVAAQLADAPSVEALKSRLLRAMKGTMDPTTVPYVTDVKQGLHVPDLGNNTARNFAKNFDGRGVFPDDELRAIAGASDNATANQMWQDLLERNGYDHMIQHNGAEDLGVPSIIIWDEKHIKPLWGAGSTQSPTQSARLVANYALAPLAAILGVGGAATRTEK